MTAMAAADSDSPIVLVVYHTIRKSAFVSSQAPKALGPPNFGEASEIAGVANFPYFA